MNIAEKFIKIKEEKTNNKTILCRYYEVRELEMCDSDWTFLNDYIMFDDIECSIENGLYQNDDGFHSIDCQKVAERMDSWLSEKLDDYGETLEEFEENFQADFKRIKKLMGDNLEFTIYYKKKDGK